MENQKRHSAFTEGDEVVLAHGSNWGTPGIFLRLRADTRWADIRERNGIEKMHPVEWLAHADERHCPADN
jgi:hypothetical protein